MYKYKIVNVKNEYIDFFKQYPNCLKKFLIEEKSMFDTKQLDLIFNTKDKALYYFNKELFNRDDYCCFHGIHKLENSITHSSITFLINEYDIEVQESSDKCIIYEYLKNYSSNFFMFHI